jgi:hypothetical protein
MEGILSMEETRYERELDWEDEIQQDGEDFILLPDGEYEFEVIEVTRMRYPGGDYYPPCPKAVAKMKVTTPQGASIFSEHLFLHTKGEYRLCAFFKAIGLRKHGEKLRMQWNSVVGRRGRAEICIDEYIDKNGAKRQSNKVRKFLDPAKAGAASTAPQATPPPVPPQTPAPAQGQQAPGGWTAGEF